MPMRFPRRAETGDPKQIKLIARVVENIAKKYKKAKKESYVTTLKDSIFSNDRPYISSGIFPVDCVVCYGLGYPTGIVEIFGPETSGKTALIEMALAEAQRRGFHTGMFASEYSLNYRRVRQVGVNDQLLIIFEAETIEEFFDELKDVVREIRKLDKIRPIVIGWDSIAATPTDMEMEEDRELGKADMGRMASQMSKFFKRMVRFLFVNNVCLLCTNQTRVDLGKMFGSKEISTGGRALRYYAWVRIRVSRIESITGPNKEDRGFILGLKTVKNKVAPPFRECRVPIYWQGGVDPVMACYYFGIDRKIFKKKGTAYRFKGHIVMAKTFPQLYARYKDRINHRLRESVLNQGGV